MALFALYRISDNGKLSVLWSDIRPNGESVQHRCTLPNQLGLIEELMDELRLMGFTPEFERRTGGGTKIFCVHRLPEGEAGDSAEVLREVCVSRNIQAVIRTTDGAQILGSMPKKSTRQHAGMAAAGGLREPLR